MKGAIKSPLKVLIPVLPLFIVIMAMPPYVFSFWGAIPIISHCH